MPEQRFTRECPVELSEHERVLLGEKLAKSLIERGAILGAKRDAIAKANARVKEIDKVITRQTEAIQNGSEMREVECLRRAGIASGTYDVVRCDTGEVIETVTNDPDTAERIAQGELPFATTTPAPATLERPGKACDGCSMADGTHHPDCEEGTAIECMVDVEDEHGVEHECGEPATHYDGGDNGTAFKFDWANPRDVFLLCDKHAEFEVDAKPIPPRPAPEKRDPVPSTLPPPPNEADAEFDEVDPYEATGTTSLPAEEELDPGPIVPIVVMAYADDGKEYPLDAADAELVRTQGSLSIPVGKSGMRTFVRIKGDPPLERLFWKARGQDGHIHVITDEQADELRANGRFVAEVEGADFVLTELVELADDVRPRSVKGKGKGKKSAEVSA